MRKIKKKKNIVIDNELILKLIKDHKSEKERILKLKRYYENLNDILNRLYKDKNKPQNKLSHNYAKYITDSFVGYFMGKPVAYKSEDEKLLEALNKVFMYNDEADTNTTIAQEQSICGYAYEIIYTDEHGCARHKCVDTEEMIVVYENDLECKIQFAIRYYEVEEDEIEIELYEKDKKTTYSLAGGSLVKVDEEIYYFDDVPIADYENNSKRMGDFEHVLSLIDAYDKTESDTANDFEYFTDALLVISGVLLDEKDEEGRPLNFKDNRVLNFADSEGKAQYLIKNINDTALENYKNRLNADIHKFANIVDMTDEKFAGNLSGVALKYKLSGMENVTGIKESKFKKGLMRRIELLITILKIKDTELRSVTEAETETELYKYTKIKPVFTRNIPQNEVEIVNMAKSLNGIISNETLLSLLPFIEDIQAEIEQIEKEKEADVLSYDIFSKEDNVEEKEKEAEKVVDENEQE